MTVLPYKPHQDLQWALHDFARNGRWGDCVDCPKDGHGRKLPELCINTARYDHNIDIKALAFQIAADQRDHERGLPRG